MLFNIFNRYCPVDEEDRRGYGSDVQALTHKIPALKTTILLTSRISPCTSISANLEGYQPSQAIKQPTPSSQVLRLLSLPSTAVVARLSSLSESRILNTNT